MSPASLIFERIQAGDRQASAELLPLVYDELRKLAALKLAGESPGQTLQATALVHEAYLRLAGAEATEPRWQGKGHFFAAAAVAMRRILVERARSKHRIKHGGGVTRTQIDVEEIAAPVADDQFLALDEALTKLAAVDQEAAKLVQLRYFTGLTLREASEILALSPRSADRLWAYAKAWLLREMRGDSPSV